MKSKVELELQNRVLLARVGLLMEYGKQARTVLAGLQEALVKLRDSVVKLQKENVELRNTIEELKAR